MAAAAPQIVAALDASEIGPTFGSDKVIAVVADGPHVVAGIEEAARTGALTVALVCNGDSPLAAASDLEICIPVGPEIVAGSTRMKGGTAQKLVLNMLSTISMVRLGRTYGNLMVKVVVTNEKLRARAHRAVSVATGADGAAVDAALEAAEGDASVAVVSLIAGVDAATARQALQQTGGAVRRAVGVAAR